MMEKATGIAQGVWRALAPYGITSDVIADAIPMRHFVFHDNDKVVANVPVPAANGNPPAHLYPQGALEQRMEQALKRYGVFVEYGVTFKSIEENGDDIRVTLLHGTAQTPEIFVGQWVIGADGAHSDVRQTIGLPFPGRDYPENWSVAEISTSKWPVNIQAQLFLQSNGVGLFLSQPSSGVVQGILNGPGAATALQDKFADADIRYERNFKVALRRVPTPRLGRVWLIGDAAHIQSPVGGQGLNLAIWDGITLAEGLMRGDLTVERKLGRRSRIVLAFTDFDYRMLASRNGAVRWARNYYWSVAARHPIIAQWFFKMISGVW